MRVKKDPRTVKDQLWQNIKKSLTQQKKRVVAVTEIQDRLTKAMQEQLSRIMNGVR